MRDLYIYRFRSFMVPYWHRDRVTSWDENKSERSWTPFWTFWARMLFYYYCVCAFVLFPVMFLSICLFVIILLGVPSPHNCIYLTHIFRQAKKQNCNNKKIAEELLSTAYKKENNKKICHIMPKTSTAIVYFIIMYIYTENNYIQTNIYSI